MVISGERKGERGKIGVGIKRKKLLGIKYITQHGEYSQYSITLNGK